MTTMPASAMPGPAAPRTRRALLAGALGGLAATVAAALGRAAPADAAAGSALIIGSQANSAGTADTQLKTSSAVVALKVLQNGTGTALMGYATHPDAGTRGVYGRTDSSFGSGVQGRNAATMTHTGCGVKAIGGNNTGLDARTDNPNGNAVVAINDSGGGVGVYSYTVNGECFHGYATGSGTALWAFSQDGTAVECYSGGTGVYASSSGVAIYGVADDAGGVGVFGSSLNGYAGRFDGRVEIGRYMDMDETTAPANPPANTARLFVRDNAGKTQLCVIFPSGAIQVIKAEA